LPAFFRHGRGKGRAFCVFVRKEQTMGLKALLTLDLPDASSKQREDFYDKLKAFNWSKLAGLTTAWFASFKDGVDWEDALETTKSDLKRCASAAKYYNYTAGVSFGSRKPEKFTY
jgi:hypothetical protein